uniref:DUF4342 domain-containing protein n=1 Tax=Thiolapillus sp. TaxID=2017437 RepID=UPI003AF9BA1E
YIPNNIIAIPPVMAEPKENPTMTNGPENKDTDWKEEIFIAGNELVDRIKELVAEGNVRRLIIRKPDGESLLEIPLTAGVAVGGAVTIIAPVLAALGALAALIKDFKLEVVRTNPAESDEEKHP